MKERFNASTLSHLDELVNFLIGKEVDMTRIKQFYRDDFSEENLTKVRQIFLDITKRKKFKLNSTKDVVIFLKGNKWCADLVPEYLKLIQLLLTVPGLSCTNKRNFSSLRRMKNYLRSTMLQDRLNNVATLHIHYEMTKELVLEPLMYEFIQKN